MAERRQQRFGLEIEPLSSRVPYFAVAGNHERTDTPIGIENWRIATGLPVGGDRLYYCFDTADGWFRVIALDTNPIVDPKNLYSRDVHIDYSKEQFDWVVARVREHTGPSMILMHHPPFSVGFHRDEWQADQIMRTAMVDSKVKPGACKIIYRGVRLGGQSAWEANARDRRAGKLRIIPEEYLPIPDALTWEEYQRHLIAEGCSEPPAVNI